MRTILVVALIAGLLITGCAGNGVPGDDPRNDINTTDSSPQKVASVAEGNNLLAIDLYKRIATEGDVFFSPYSISSALAMTYEGAKGTTADEMAKTLYLPTDVAVLRPGYASLFSSLQGKQEGYEISTANALWAQQSYPFLPEYLSTVKQYYGGTMQNLDFQTKTEESRLTINSWVEDRTHDRIKDLLAPGTVTGQTRLILTNAIYFKGKWVYEFDKKDTYDAQFHVTSSNTVVTKMMTQTNKEARYGYAEDERVKVLSLDYKGNKTSMVILLPKEIDGIAALEASLSAEKIAAWRSSLVKTHLPTYIPKFTYTRDFELSETLKTMGMVTAFSGDADFSGMTGNRDLVISKVIHKAFVKVDEEGTEAAAATAVIMEKTAAFNPGPIREFRADHPFLFLIVDNDSGAILFMGKVTDPSKLQEE